MGRRKKRVSPSVQRNAARRGKAFEVRTAKDLDGFVYNGTAGDVQYMGPDGWIRGECKSYQGLRGYGLLKDHIEQAIRNVDKTKGFPWALHLTGGRPFRNGQSFTLIPTTFYKHLLGLAKNDDPELEDILRRVIREELPSAGSS